jgi:hypothetical protein
MEEPRQSVADLASRALMRVEPMQMAGEPATLEDQARAEQARRPEILPADTPRSGPSPAEVREFHEGQAQRTGLLTGLRNISEGLGGIRILSPGHYFLGRPSTQEPLVAESIRDKLAETQDRVTPEEAAFYQSQGYRVPVGISRRVVEQALPQLARGDYHRAHQDLATQRLELAARALDERQGRYSQTAGRKLKSEIARERGEWLKPTSRVGKLRDAAIAADQVRTLITKDNPVATRTALVMVAKKLAGDTGVLTQQDIEAYEGKIGIPGFFRGLQMAVTGDFTAAQKRMLREVADELASLAHDELDRERSGRIDSFAETYKEELESAGIDDASLRAMLGAESRGASMDIPGGGVAEREAIGPDGSEWFAPAGTDMTKYPGWRWK